ncbi:ferritin [Sorangium cellulosum]|uniref:Ferritin n=1 Tax=Sorangium cellulosum TaxID=56 RepID=A0A2L0ELN3_SORCE|nr:DUF2383 domain-containing protein [Sorangium cellulosum]AUX40208.1 ferritin [Sorangium cellulosum]
MDQLAFTDESVGFDGLIDDDSIEQLKSFCRGEIAAVETYRQAIAATNEEWLAQELQRNLASHEARVTMLRRRIEELGGDPPASSGPWGAFAKVVEGTAVAIGGPKAALSALVEGEDHGLKDYRDDLEELDCESHVLVRDVILPQQVSTLRTLADLKRLVA